MVYHGTPHSTAPQPGYARGVVGVLLRGTYGVYHHGLLLSGCSDHFIGFPRSRPARGIRHPDPDAGNGGFTGISRITVKGARRPLPAR